MTMTAVGAFVVRGFLADRRPPRSFVFSAELPIITRRDAYLGASRDFLPNALRVVDSRHRKVSLHDVREAIRWARQGRTAVAST